MSETKQATGICQEVSERGEWVTFHIDTGGQYPVKLATKTAELVELGRATARQSQLATWTYNEVESNNVNEHTGKPFINRYLERVEVGGASESTERVATPEAGAQVQPGLLGAAKDRSIVRQTCIKAAAALVAGFGSNPDHEYDAALAVMKTADRFERWIYRDVDEVPF